LPDLEPGPDLPFMLAKSDTVRLGFCCLGACITVGLIWSTEIPLGVPAEWTWQRTNLAEDYAWSLFSAAPWIVLLGVCVWRGNRQFEAVRPGSDWSRAGWLVGLAILSFFALSGLRELAPPEYRSAKSAFVLYFPGPSGYFTEARKVRDTREFLAHYAQQLNQGDVLHQGTHPPGLIVGYRGLMWLCQFTWIQQVLLQTQPTDLSDAFQIISNQSRSTGGPPLTDRERCVLWLAALLMQACAAATVIPLYALLRLNSPRTTSWQLVSFWPLIPAITLFLPKSDTCFPVLGCTVLALWLYGLRQKSSGIRSTVLCGAAGAVFWLGMTLSLVMLPIGFLAALLTLFSLRQTAVMLGWPAAGKRFMWALIAGGFGFLIPTVALWSTTGCNLFSVWIQNYHNHAGFYLQYPRTYWLWLLVNPVELSFAVGLPITILALLGMITAIRNRQSVSRSHVFACLATWSLLWISGKNMGEAARLWIFLMPWLIWMSAADWQSLTELTPQQQRQRWLACWTCQVIATVATVSRVVGFHL
jgi:hypothetical protein